MDGDSSSPGSPGEAAFMGVLLVVMLACLIAGWKTPETVVFFCLVLVWNVGLVDMEEALSGFSNAGMLAVGALFVVIKGVDKSQLADKAARQVFGLRTSQRAGLARMMSLCFFLSAFLNNTPVVALLIPIVRDWARARGFSPSIFLIPLSFSTIQGGLLTVIGTSTNLVVQGLVLAERAKDPTIEAIGFFEPGYVALPVGIIGLLFMVMFAPHLLPSRGGLFRYVRDRATELLTEVQVMDDFPYKGEPASLVLTRWGLPLDNLIKIRRKLAPGMLHQMNESSEGFEGLPRSAPHPLTKVEAVIMERNQSSLKADTKYSYRTRTESLWGKSMGGHKSGKDERGVSMIDAPAGRHSPSRTFGTFPRKRWSSDADASNSSGLLRPAAEARGAGAGGSASDGEIYTDLFPVSAAEPIQAGDVLFLSCPQATMIDFQAGAVSKGQKGLKFLDVSALDLPGHGTEFFETVLSDHNQFVGRSASRNNADFAAFYNVSVVAVRRRGQADATNTGAVGGGSGAAPSSARATTTDSTNAPPVEVADAPEVSLEEGFEPSPLHSGSAAVSSMGGSPTAAGARASGFRQAAAAAARSNAHAVAHDDERDLTGASFKAGDVVLVLAKEEFKEKYGASRDFYLVTNVGSVPTPVSYYDYLPLLVFVGMLTWVLLDADMVQASFAAGAVLLFGGWVDAKRMIGYIDWSLLLLIGSALGLSKGIENSGLADYIGGAIRNAGISAEASLYLLFAFTTVCTELITNNAAAALATPVAFSIARELGVSYKPFVITVMLAASASFMTPIGYQTNTLVWGPGGYKFTDFLRIGTPLNVIYLVCGCLLVPRIFPF